MKLFRVLSKLAVAQRDGVRPLVVALPEEPPHGHEDGQTSGHQTGVVHRLRVGRKRVREAEDDDERDDVDAAQDVDGVANGGLHPEIARRDRRAPGEDVRQNGEEVREG